MSLIKRTDPVLTRNYTPTKDLKPGDVVIVGNRPEICSVRAFSGEKNVGVGYFGGEYDGGADGALATGDEVYYNTATGKVTKTVTGAYHLGYVSYAPSDCADGDSICIIHAPNGTVIAVEEGGTS